MSSTTNMHGHGDRSGMSGRKAILRLGTRCSREFRVRKILSATSNGYTSVEWETRCMAVEVAGPSLIMTKAQTATGSHGSSRRMKRTRVLFRKNRMPDFSVSTVVSQGPAIVRGLCGLTVVNQ
jgi:hypothetical protein